MVKGSMPLPLTAYEKKCIFGVKRISYMEHLSLEIFDLATAENKNPTTSKYATLPEDASITITDTR